MRRIFLTCILGCMCAVNALANADAQLRIVADLTKMGGTPSVTEEIGNYTRIQLTDSATLEIYEAEDNIIAVMTVCAPQCSSCARVYNKEGEYLFPLEPSVTSIFPLATMNKQTGKITWVNNDNWEY